MPEESEPYADDIAVQYARAVKKYPTFFGKYPKEMIASTRTERTDGTYTTVYYKFTFYIGGMSSGMAVYLDRKFDKTTGDLVDEKWSDARALESYLSAPLYADKGFTAEQMNTFKTVLYEAMSAEAEKYHLSCNENVPFTMETCPFEWDAMGEPLIMQAIVGFNITDDTRKEFGERPYGKTDRLAVYARILVYPDGTHSDVHVTVG